MAEEFEIIITSRGWALDTNDCRLVASDFNWDHGKVKVTLAAYKLLTPGTGEYSTVEEQLLHRDSVNLTGDKSRQRFLNRLNAADVKLSPKSLLALEDVIRRTPRASRNGKNKKTADHPPPSDFSGKVKKLAYLKHIYDKWLLLNDEDLIEVVLGSMAAHTLKGELVWLLLVAPPSGVKTEILRALELVPGLYPLSETLPCQLLH